MQGIPIVVESKHARAITPRWTVAATVGLVIVALAGVGPLALGSETEAPAGRARQIAELREPARATPPREPEAAPQPAAPARRSGARDRLAIFKGFGAWLDMYAYDAADPQRVAATMKRNGVRTFYLQTGTSYTRHAVNPKVGPWLKAAHDHGIEVVGWYLPSYRSLPFDVPRTVAAARYSYKGHRFDAIGLDIEDRSVLVNPYRFGEKAWKHAMFVRRELGPDYPIAAIPPTPLQMRVAPGHWAGFPWKKLAKYTDAMVLMSYWSDRSGCPHRKPQHCPYEFTKRNVEITRRLTGGKEIIHVIGGLSTRIDAHEVREFVRGARDAKADGASLYEVVLTRPSWWRIMRPLASLGRD